MDTAADNALMVFWEKGYEATSMDDLVAATGLSVSSIYAAFNDKRGVFEATLDRYHVHMAETLSSLADGAHGLRDVIEFVERVRAGLISADHPAGCLMVNTMVELEAVDESVGAMTAAYRARVQRSLRHALRRAESRGEIPDRTAASRSSLVLAALFGALVTARAGRIDEADAMLRSLVAEIRRWRH